MELSSFEHEVMGMLLSGDNKALSFLRAQLQLAKVSERVGTGTGFVVKFSLPNDVIHAPIRTGRVHFGDVEAKISGLRHGAGFVLFLRDGQIEMLEGYSFEEPWPEEITEYELSYKDPIRKSLNEALG